MDLVAGRAFAQERRPIRHVDWFLIVIAIVLSVVGLLLLYSATSQTLRQGGFDPFDRVNKQAITMVLGAGGSGDRRASTTGSGRSTRGSSTSARLPP